MWWRKNKDESVDADYYYMKDKCKNVETCYECHAYVDKRFMKEVTVDHTGIGLGFYDVDSSHSGYRYFCKRCQNGIEYDYIKSGWGETHYYKQIPAKLEEVFPFGKPKKEKKNVKKKSK